MKHLNRVSKLCWDLCNEHPEWSSSWRMEIESSFLSFRSSLGLKIKQSYRKASGVSSWLLESFSRDQNQPLWMRIESATAKVSKPIQIESKNTDDDFHWNHIRHCCAVRENKKSNIKDWHVWIDKTISIVLHFNAQSADNTFHAFSLMKFYV